MSIKKSIIEISTLLTFIGVLPLNAYSGVTTTDLSTTKVVPINSKAIPVVPETVIVKSSLNATDLSGKKLRIGLEGGVLVHNYSLRGTGYQSTIKNTDGSFPSAKINYSPNIDSYFSYAFKARMENAEFSSLLGLTPSRLTLKNNYYQAIVFARLLDGFENYFLKELKLGIGYSFLKRTAAVTTPNAAFTSQTSHGLTLNLVYEYAFKDESHIDTYAQIYMPSSFKEDSKNTGYHYTTLGYELGASFNYFLTPRLDVSAGITYRIDHSEFLGTGLRGTTNGVETLTTMAFPIGLIFKF